MRNRIALAFAVAGVIAGAVLTGCGPRTTPSPVDQRLSECLAFVADFERAYKADPPKSESGPSDLHGTVPAAETQCRAGRYDDARKAINTAGMICSLNGGCSKHR